MQRKRQEADQDMGLDSLGGLMPDRPQAKFVLLDSKCRLGIGQVNVSAPKVLVRPVAVLSEGCYILRSNVNDWTAEELWRAYIHLTDAEAAFRIQKDELRLRPLWHQSAERVQAHILVCFLAFALHKTLEGWSQKAGLGKSIPTLLEEFARIQSTDVVLPLSDGRTAHLRCIVRPDRAQSILLDHLGLNLPERLRIPKVFAQM